MNIGFTGSRKGLTSIQKEKLNDMLKKYKGYLFHHGDCIGADEEAFAIAKDHLLKTIAYPCNLTNMRAYTDSQIIMEPDDPLKRNKEIVNNSDLLIAGPSTEHEVLRSGTWATIRYAKKLERPIRIIWPNGEIEKYN